MVRLADLRVNEVKDVWADVKPLMEHEGVRTSDRAIEWFDWK